MALYRNVGTSLTHIIAYLLRILYFFIVTLLLINQDLLISQVATIPKMGILLLFHSAFIIANE